MDPDRDTWDPSSAMKAKTAPVFRQALFFSKKQNESFVQLALLTHLGEALAAVNRTVRLGLKGDPSLAAAGSAGSSEELAGTAGGVLARVTAGLAALGLILEALFRIEFLLTGGENELCAALFALQRFVFEHDKSSLLKNLPLGYIAFSSC